MLLFAFVGCDLLPDDFKGLTDSESNWFITMCEQYGSPYTSLDKNNHFAYDNETNRGFVKMFKEWFDKGYFTTKEIYGGYTSGLFNFEEDQKSYMSIGSTGIAMHQRPSKTDEGYAFDVGIAPIPQVDPENPKAISQGPSLCIFNNANKQEIIALWLFMKFLTTDAEFQAEFSMTSGYMPVIQSVKNLDYYADFLDSADGGDKITALAVKVGLEMADSYYVSPAFNGSSLARDRVGTLMRYCFVNNPESGETVDEFIKKAFEASVKSCYDSM